MIFNDLHPKSRVWLYISSLTLNNNSKDKIVKLFDDFSFSWKSHGKSIDGRIKLIENNILIVGAGYLGTDMCGRSVDSQVRFVNKIDNHFRLDFLSRQNLGFLINNKTVVFNFHDINKLIKQRVKSDSSIPYTSFCNKRADKIHLKFSQSKLGDKYFPL
jgi:hypothetical protein